MANIPADTASLHEGAGVEGGIDLPAGAFQLPNDARMARYLGAAPPAGHGVHRYFVTVHALDVEDIAVPPDGTPAFLGFTMASHILGRATLIATAVPRISRKSISISAAVATSDLSATLSSRCPFCRTK